MPYFVTSTVGAITAKFITRSLATLSWRLPIATRHASNTSLTHEQVRTKAAEHL
jgi:hypothetical protein